MSGKLKSIVLWIAIVRVDKMVDALGEIVCFVTASVSFVYGTLLGLFSGEKFYYKRKHGIDKRILRGSYPLCLAMYTFGFVITYRHFFNENITLVIAAFSSALVLAQFVVFYSVTRANNRKGRFITKMK